MSKLDIAGYAHEAMKQATFEQLRDGSWVGRVPSCPGVIVFGNDQAQCAAQLPSVIEEWAQLGIEQGYALPSVDGTE